MANISNSQQTLPDIKFYRSFGLNHSYANYFFVILGKLVMERLHKANRNKLIFCFFLGILISINISAQNWNVFNKQYRYNYIYDNNSLITNVLFADSIKQIGNDSVYFMNRIGIECTGTCPTITTAITTTAMVIVPNMPQFLQRTIIKYSNGLVMLKDTAKQVIKPNCILNETWLFDSVNNKNAQCINLSTQTIFSITDSIKTILIDGTDTLKLSKQFGIIQFPNVYNKNKYYRLVGIENESIYEQSALYGLKVPNAWDFYNFDVGDKFCYYGQNEFFCGSSCFGGSDTIKTIEIINKIISPSTGFNYTINQKKQVKTGGYAWMFGGSYSTDTITNVNVQINYNNISKNLNANTMYPGQISTYFSYPGNNEPANIVKFGVDNNGKFYKYYGPNCQSYSPLILPNTSAVIGYSLSPNQYLELNNNYVAYSLVFGVGLGQVTKIYINYPPTINKICMTCALKSGIPYLGTEIFVGMIENQITTNKTIIYPNPTNGEVTIDSKKNEIIKIELLNSIGQLILIKEINEVTFKLNLKDYNNGIYLIKIYNKSGLQEIKKILKD